MIPRKNYKFLLYSAILTLLFACNPFNPEDEEFAEITQLEDNTKVSGLMSNFAYSYTFKDSFLYEELLDSSFVFKYFNPASNYYESWGKAEDLRITNRMFRTFENLYLVFNSDIPDDDSDTVRLILSFRLSLISGSNEESFTGYAKFHLRKNLVGTDSFAYKIYYWEDISLGKKGGSN